MKRHNVKDNCIKLTEMQMVEIQFDSQKNVLPGYLSLLRKNKFNILMVLTLFLGLTSCNKDKAPNEPNLIIKLVVDSTQVRLGNLGTPASIPAGNSGQHPLFNLISAHYLELAPNAFTALGSGAKLYHAAETTAGGSTAIDFSKAIVKSPGEIFLVIPLKDVPTGSYEWARLSLSYQNYDVKFYYNNLPLTGTVASFVGYNNYISSFWVKNQTVTLNQNKLQGFWAFETINGVQTGQAPGTTVPNPIASTSPIPAGSCVVTGQFAAPFVITGNETQDITVKMSLSTNKSFEWNDINGNGKWDVGPGTFENVVDMGLRGLIPIVE